jgi:CheY-like chemotaxis protein
MSDDFVTLRGCRTLIVEDEFAVLIMLEDTLAELGCNVVATASSLADALALAADVIVDVAILDVNLSRGEKVYPVAQLLTERRIPIVFSTGYGAAGLEEKWRRFPTLQKPYLDDDLRRAIVTVLSP